MSPNRRLLTKMLKGKKESEGVESCVSFGIASNMLVGLNLVNSRFTTGLAPWQSVMSRVGQLWDRWLGTGAWLVGAGLCDINALAGKGVRVVMECRGANEAWMVLDQVEEWRITVVEFPSSRESQ